MPKFQAKVVVTLRFIGDHPPVVSKPTDIEFSAASSDLDAAWEEFLGESTIDMIEFPEGVDPFSDEVLEENWEYLSITLRR